MALPFHDSSEATGRERGYAFGQANKAAIENTIAVYRRIFAEARSLTQPDIERFGDSVATYLSANHPDALDEIAGLAAGAKCSEAELVAINARTELLAGTTAPECSVIGYQPHLKRGSGLLALTWDWHPALTDSRVLWRIRPTTGPSFITLTEAGILAKVGLNDSGLATALNFLTSAADRGTTGTPIHVLLRLVLANCANPGAALKLLLNTKTAASACITIGYGEPRDALIFAVECSPHGAQAIPPNDRGHLIHTNHFLCPPPHTTDVGLVGYPGTLVRYSHLASRLAELGDPSVDDLSELLQSHFAAPDSVCRHQDDSEPWPELRQTLVAAVVDLNARSLVLSDGPPCEGRWQQLTATEDLDPEARPRVGADAA